MRTPSGILHVVDFKTDQIVAAIQPEDYWDDKRHWELKNNVDMLDFTAFDGTDHAVTLQQQNLVLKEVRDGRIVPYVITETEKNSDTRSITTYASGAWIQIAKSGIIKPQRIESKTVNEFIDLALLGMKWQRGITEYAGFHTMTIDEYIDPLTFLKKIASLFKLEIRYRVEIKGSRIIGWYVDMIQKRGYDTGKEIELGKDLVGVTRIEHTRNICTALVGFVKGEGDKVITIESINKGLPYIVDADAFQRWNEHGQHKFGFYTPETEELDMTPKRLLTLMEIELKKRVNSSISYEVEAQSIGRIFGLEHELINEGDTIKIKDTGFTPELYLEARVIAGDESFTDPTQDKYEFGDYREIVNQNEELRKIYNRILSSLGNKQEMIDQLDKLVQEANETASNAKKESEAAKTLAEKVQENVKNNAIEIIESKYPPTTGLKPYKTLWRDISNGKPGILKIWTGTAWESVVPDVESVKKETLNQVNKDIETTKTELNQKVQEAQNQATGQFNKVQEGLQGVSRTISNIENKQGEIDKKVTKFEQDSSGFKTSIESLTKKDTEISNKLNTVESTVEGTKKTISEVQQTTNDLKKKTTEIEEKAGKITEKLTSLETRKVNVRNYVINSDFSNGTNSWIGITNATLFKFVDVNISEASAIKKGLQITSNKAFVYQKLPADVFKKKKGIASCYINVSSFTPGTDYPRLYMRFTYDQNGTEKQYYAILKQQEVTNGWIRISIPFDTTGYTGELKEVRVNIATADTTTIDATFTGIMVTFGDLIESWNLAPEDGVTQGIFQSKTTEIEKSVDGVKTTVTNVQNSQAGFEKRMSNVEQTATGLSSTVSNLNNVVSDQGKKLTEANTKLEQQATAINAKVELKQVEDYVAGFKIPELKQTVNQNKQDLLDELANKLATEQFNQKMTLVDNRLTINEQGINAAAKKTEVYTKTQADGQFATDSYVRDMESRLQLTEKGVSISVKENDVIAAINMSKENIRLNAARIDLVGKVNAEWIKAGLLSGCQIRTSNTDNYVSLDDQFIRLYEKGVARAFLGHYRKADGSVQPTFILGSDEKNNAPAGTLFMSQAGAGWSGAYARIGISDSIENNEVQRSVYWEMQRNGLSILNANDYHVFYAGNGSWYFRRGKTGLYQTSLVVEDNSTESDLRLPNVTIRNSRASGYTGVIQLKSSVTQNGWGAVQGNFMTPSLREYKSNIRDISFSALEKIRSLKIRQFNYKNAVNELYRMREERNPNDPPLTTEDIKTYYGLIVDECDEMFVDENGKGIHLYSYASIGIKGLQEVDTKVQEQEIEIASLKSQVASQEDRIARLEELLLQ
ncbi:tail fiber domain-containing protein [Bacillus tropicus]|uniref:phage tail spike protein n=1 Tax=Bacillus cereus group TaxID=86661 RepID=UPI000984606A|nr:MULTISPECIES: phage tail spike protein [Bacillus cereus group]MCB4844082.1 tail fiber domain-containing protein [Bacillus tropicus]MDA1858937.1 tail fiber domain-containing protein [Bacillus cereus group sp. BY122LC]OOL14320.1 peptidase S74 [Bacillus cereus]PJZ19956.1 peptidase S74 [Bacillus cereus]